ncbi:hypothetical protein AHAS_Ahas19G0235800 [Arachis hypogaea]
MAQRFSFRFSTFKLIVNALTLSLPIGVVASRSGSFVAGSGFFEAIISGKGSHAAIPQHSIDPILAASNVIVSLQHIISREADPLDSQGGIEDGEEPKLAVIRELREETGIASAEITEGTQILCPCKNCNNCSWRNREDVYEHLVCDGFDKGYNKWIFHGECGSSKSAEKDGSEIQDNLDKLLEETFMMSRQFETSQFDDALDEDENEEEPDEETKKFYKLIHDAHQELYLGSYEARLGGPVQYRWMYPIERFLLKLKNYVRNKSRPEGSIAEGYLADECLTFCSRYLNDNVRTKFNNPTKNLDGPIGNGVMISLDPLMWEQSHRYVLFNCNITAPYIKQHEEIVFSDAHSLGDKWDKTKDHCLTFTELFEDFARNSSVNKELKWLSRGPNVAARRFSAYVINGYKFVTEDCERKTQNTGVIVISSTVKFRNEKDEDPEVENVTYYGVLKDIPELDYHGHSKYVLFKCDWFQSKKDNFGLTLVNFRKPIYENDPFVFATQVRQVYYTEDPSDTWHVVTNTIPRDLFDIYGDLDNDDMEKFKDVIEICQPYDFLPSRGLAANEDDLRKADAAAKELEAAEGLVDLLADLDKLQGRWKLIYSSAFSSRTLGGSRPGPPTGKILPRVTHWQSPNYFVLDWLAKALKLPHDFHSTGEVVILRTVGKDALPKLVTYASDQTHSSLLKACQIGGLNPELCRSLKTDVSTNYALSPEVFSEAVSRDIASGLIPFFLCAIVGTTSLTAIDPLPEMRKIELVDCAFLSGFINVVSELIESNHSGCSRGVSTEELIHINTSIVLEALGAAPVPGATTLTEKLNHQGIDVVSLSQIKEVIDAVSVSKARAIIVLASDENADQCDARALRVVLSLKCK